MLLEMVNEAAMTGAKLPKEGAAPATADKAKSPSAALADPLLSSFQIGGEKTFALLREMRTSGDFQQAAAAEKLEASILKSRSGAFEILTCLAESPDSMHRALVAGLFVH